MNWNHLYCFYEAAKHKSVKKAAEKMGLASSTVSEQIKKLEQNYGVQLFERKVREIVLTKKGEEVYSHAKGVFSNGMRLVDHLTPHDDGGYDVTFSIESHLESPNIAAVLADYYSTYSDFGHTITKRSKNFSQTMYYLENDTVDVAISDKKLSNELYENYLVAQNQLRFYVNTAVAAKYRDLPFEKLVKKLPIGFLSSDEKMIVNAKQVLKEQKVYLKEAFFSEHLYYLSTLAQRGEIVLAAIGNESIFQELYCLGPQHDIGVPTYAILKKKNENLLFARKLKDLLMVDTDVNQLNLH
ncbi:LysR family transcriptional regulator [Halobacteriovorax sp. GFR7]|uniref:LysR family transcriptional regulator n=1 Tax=unclassified Halobacteriovorax TaxID=2639665 RepID=UPI0037161D6D